MSLSDQRNILEQSLNARMIHFVASILRQWAQELGVDLYTDRLNALERNYQCAVDYFLANDNSDRDEVLARLTHDGFILMDELYGEICLKRGLSPNLDGFDEDNSDSVLHYFSTCVHLREQDLDWLDTVIHDANRSSLALVALASLAQNLREHFQLRAMMALIDAIHAENEMVSHQAIISTIMLFVQWDARLDYFPELDEALMDVLDVDRAFAILLVIVRMAHSDFKQIITNEVKDMDEFPDEVKQLLEQTRHWKKDKQLMDKIKEVVDRMPKNESDYFRSIAEVLPQSWVCDYIVGDEESRIQELSLLYLSLGKMDLMWDHLDEAEDWLVKRLRSSKATPLDYLNYAHCCFLRGDRALAYENYREARLQFPSAKKFMAVFRPDRKNLMDKGIPIEDIYLMEDQLLQIS